jgi:hypothetical protein
VTDCLYRLAGVREALPKLDGLRIHTQLVRIHHSTGQQQRVEFVRLRGVEPNVHRDFVAPSLVIPSFDFLICGGHNLGSRACLIECLSRLQQFRLLETIGYKELPLSFPEE